MRLSLCGMVVAAGLGCADAGARLAGRLLAPAPEPARAQPAKRPAGWSRYVVQPGETLGGIAACHLVSVDALARGNQIPDPDHVRAGAVLRVPHGRGCASPRLSGKAPTPKRADGDRGGAGPSMAREGEAGGLLADAELRYDGADFEQALSLAEACVRALAPYPKEAEADALRARCHVVSGMAAAGLERRERAIAEFRQALDLAPDLALDPERSSPRVLELVAAARAGPSASRAFDGQLVESSTR